jgi:antitoxin MazE
MKANIIQIGNSKGLRLSKTILEKYDIRDTVEILLEEDCIKLISVSNPRKDWEKAFEKMHHKGDDKLLIDDFFEDEKLAGWA